MALYTVKKTARVHRGTEIERYELYVGERYITGIDIPANADMNWYRLAAKRVHANLLNRNDDPNPQFGALAGDRDGLAFAEMLNV